MAGREPRPPGDDQRRADVRRAVVAVATIAWSVTTFLPILNPKIPAVPEMGPAFLAFLGAYIAVPEIRRRRGGKGDDE